jgi:hypothetical protein
MKPEPLISTSRPREMAASMSRSHAEKCAASVREYWQKLGHYPDVRVVVIAEFPGVKKTGAAIRRCGYGVRSDMRNGVPLSFMGAFVSGDFPRQRR